MAADETSAAGDLDATARGGLVGLIVNQMQSSTQGSASCLGTCGQRIGRCRPEATDQCGGKIAATEPQPVAPVGGTDGDPRCDRRCCGHDGGADAARLILEQQGFESLDQWSQLVERLERPEQQVLGQLRRLIQRQTWMRDQFASKAEARFLERKNELDQVVYSLLRLKNSFLARELYLQIESEESNFSDLAKRYAEGPERNTNGIVGPVSLTQAHPVLVEKLRVAQPGVLLEPFPIADWWLVVRLERYPLPRSRRRSDQMCREMFKAWIAEETTSTLSRLADQSSDFSIS